MRRGGMYLRTVEASKDNSNKENAPGATLLRARRKMEECKRYTDGEVKSKRVDAIPRKKSLNSA